MNGSWYLYSHSLMQEEPSSQAKWNKGKAKGLKRQNKKRTNNLVSNANRQTTNYANPQARKSKSRVPHSTTKEPTTIKSANKSKDNKLGLTNQLFTRPPSKPLPPPAAEPTPAVVEALRSSQYTKDKKGPMQTSKPCFGTGLSFIRKVQVGRGGN